MLKPLLPFYRPLLRHINDCLDCGVKVCVCVLQAADFHRFSSLPEFYHFDTKKKMFRNKVQSHHSRQPILRSILTSTSHCFNASITLLSLNVVNICAYVALSCVQCRLSQKIFVLFCVFMSSQNKKTHSQWCDYLDLPHIHSW